ncbi:hypothetical protein I4U23_012218 [Adineta vaga]|nr:hypothetical protein I4U23_012218 [Adineta vaga]
MYTYRQRTLRTSPCSIYLFSQSFFDLCHLINTLFTRILFTLSIETYSKNDFYCRIRSFIAEVTSLCAVSCLCLGTFDRCMFTSRQESLRRWSSHIFAYRSLTIIIIVWSLINIPQIIFRGMTNNTCTSLSINFTLYLNYCHTPLFYGVIPIITLFYLRKHTMQNLQNLQHTVILRSRMERYINRMLLFQISLALFTFLLLMIQYIYTAVTIYTQKDALHTAIQNLSLQIVRLIFYLNYTSAFYINYFVSPEIRLIIRRLFTCKYQRIRPVNAIGRGEQH